MCSLNLALRGHRETSHNGVCEGGNFLAIVALMDQYDEVIAEVFSLPSRTVKYLTHGIQEELISLIASAVRSIILDTTSNITRKDQLSVVARWVNGTDNSVEPVESFLGFVEVTSPDAQGLVETTKSLYKNWASIFQNSGGGGGRAMMAPVL